MKETLLRKIKQANSNARRQRRKAELGKATRVSHTFWEQVAMDYRRQLLKVTSN